MGAETEAKEKHAEQRQTPSPTTLTPGQFLAWKRQKVSSSLILPFALLGFFVVFPLFVPSWIDGFGFFVLLIYFIIDN